MVPSQFRLDVGQLQDERVAEEFAYRLCWGPRDLSVSRDPEELWSAFKTTILDVAGGCLGTQYRAKGHWIPSTSVAGPGFMAELSFSGS